MGRKFKEPSVQEDIKHYPFTVIEKNNKPVIQIDTKQGPKTFTPEEISAMILSKMRSIAVSFLILLTLQIFPFDNRKFISDTKFKTL